LPLIKPGIAAPRHESETTQVLTGLDAMAIPFYSPKLLLTALVFREPVAGLADGKNLA
jgi:hypothetical protein